MPRCEPAVLVLRADEALQMRVRATHSASAVCQAAEVRVTQVAHLALADEVIEGGKRLLYRSCRIGPVDLIQVDPVGAQPAQGVLHRPPDVAARSTRTPVDAVVLAEPADVAAELGGDQDIVAFPLQNLSERSSEAP
jgi:hypothetical protein